MALYSWEEEEEGEEAESVVVGEVEGGEGAEESGLLCGKGATARSGLERKEERINDYYFDFTFI